MDGVDFVLVGGMGMADGMVGSRECSQRYGDEVCASRGLEGSGRSGSIYVTVSVLRSLM